MASILVTGGTGSFGQAFVETLIKGNIFANHKIIVYSRDEHKQELMDKKLMKYLGYDRLRFFIGDIRDKERLQLAMHDAFWVIHAAALKIVPYAEYNPFEYVKTNIQGSQNVIDCLLNSNNRGAGRKCIAVSTDKAVKPVNLYGATKLTMEKMFLAANNIHGLEGPMFSVCRYGNVANSNGSVIPLFKTLNDLKAPLPITDERMTRFWITLTEAVEFVLAKLHHMNGNEVFTPNMPSFKIVDLAEAFGAKTEIVGIRPGEKLHEEIKDGVTSDNNTTWLGVTELKSQLETLGAI